MYPRSALIVIEVNMSQTNHPHSTEANTGSEARERAYAVVPEGIGVYARNAGGNAQERFFLDENKDVIDRLNPVAGLSYYYSNVPPTQFSLRESLVGRRLDVLVSDLIINLQPEQTDHWGHKWQPSNSEAWALSSALFHAINASVLNSVEPSRGAQARVDGTLKREKAFLYEITSLSLFCDDVERLLRDLYGDVARDMLDQILLAIRVVTEEFTRYVRHELWDEHQKALDWDYLFGVGLPGGCGLSGSDHRRGHAALHDLKKRVRDVRKHPDEHSKYTMEFATRFGEFIKLDDEGNRTVGETITRLRLVAQTNDASVEIEESEGGSFR
jgi:hypothetical protein